MVALLAFAAFTGIRASDMISSAKPKPTCACCGTSCECTGCTCESKAIEGESCDCCGGSTCCTDSQ